MNLLVSYAHIQKDRKWIPVLEYWADKGIPLMIDSGAFSATFSGVPIDHAAYIKFVQKLSAGRPHVEYIQLDQPRNLVVSRANLAKEYSLGMRSLPVHIANTTEKEFADLVRAYGPRICMAGGQNSEPEKFLARVALCQSAVGGKASIHALGFTPGLWPLKSLAYSFDSTSWLAALKWGSVQFYDPVRGIKSISFQDLRKKKLASLHRAIRDTFMFSGVRESDLRGPYGGRTQRSMTSFFSADAWLRLAARYEQVGKRFYFAAVKPWMLTQLIMAQKHQRHIGIDWRSLETDMQPLLETTSKGATDLALLGAHLDAAWQRWQTAIRKPE